MIKIAIPFIVSSLFLSSNYVLADSKKSSTAIKLMSTSEAMHKKIVKKVKAFPSLAQLKTKTAKDC